MENGEGKVESFKIELWSGHQGRTEEGGTLKVELPYDVLAEQKWEMTSSSNCEKKFKVEQKREEELRSNGSLTF